METAPLKTFATSARTELIREVTARITAVLSQGSAERVENPTAVSSLEKAVAAGGGGDKGKAHVADKVAYTWFNRIIALRFMDANGYTGIGVVSPAADQVGQPEVLAAAKRGQIDREVVSNDRYMAAISGLLNGTRQPRPGVDAQAEAYSLLLASYCQFWHKAMPFMFDRQGDFTELLIPANLLASDSALNRSVGVLSEDVCKDVEVIGWLYQFYISERKNEVFAGFKKNKRAGADEIPAATQLFTPHWIVRYLVENSLGRLWMLNKPTSGLVHQMDYYVAPLSEEADYYKITTPEELKIIDPACGSGHMLTYAFDLLYFVYEEEGYAPSEIPSLILANNLYGTEIDPRAGALAAFALTMKAVARRKLFLRNPVEPNICVIHPMSFAPDEIELLRTMDGDPHVEEAFWNQFTAADVLGSLVNPDSTLVMRLAEHLNTVDPGGDLYFADAVERARQVVMQAQYLSSRYCVVVANPPYMGSGSMSSVLSDFATLEYRRAKTDLFAMFIERCIALGGRGAFVGMITMQSWLFIASYEALRRHVLEDRRIVSLLQLGTAAFDTIGGAVVSTTAFVIENVRGNRRESTFVDLTLGRDERTKSAALVEALKAESSVLRRQLPAERFLELPGAPFAHAIQNFDVFHGPRISARWRSGGRLKTHDGARYIRYWWEVSKSGKRWRALIKGGDFRPFYGNRDFVADFSPAAVDFYRSHGGLYPDENRGVMGICWTKIGRLSFRIKSVDEEYDSASPTLLPDHEDDVFPLLAYLNSSEVRGLVAVLNPTINTQVANVLELPQPMWSHSEKSALTRLGQDMVAFARSDWEASETADGYVRHRMLTSTVKESVREAADFVLAECEARALNQRKTAVEIDAIVGPLLATGLTGPASSDLVSELPSASELVTELMSYAVGCMFGRYSLDEPGLILADHGSTLQDYLIKVSSPTFPADADNVIPIVDGDWFEDDIVDRLRLFLRAAFGDKRFEENLAYVTESLGVKNLREYFITKAGKSKFYDHHVQRYKKRPIYWLYSSPKGSFNALIYLHRYAPSTTSTVLTYLREYVTKLESSLQQAERAGNAKEADRLRKILVELNEYEHDTLYPKASENIIIDLDDGVKANYPKLGGALRKIAGLESSGD